jgi:hypothetical protein
MGRISGRQWGLLMAASGENYMAAVRMLLTKRHRRRAADPHLPRQKDPKSEMLQAIEGRTRD